MSRQVLVTGATGLLGSHIAAQLAAAGHPVRALVRPTSDTRFLASLGVETLPGDLTSPASLETAVEDCQVVYHAASKVGDWGPWSEFERDGLQATETLGRIAARRGVERFVHISSTSAYGHPAEGGPPVDEDAPLGQNLWPYGDHYTRVKVEQERILWRIAREDRLPLTVIRPSWLYGERDRTTTARIVSRLRGRGIPLIGRGENPLSAVYAGEVARAAIMAAADPDSRGEAYNVTDLGPITQRAFFELWARACDARPPRRSLGTRSYPFVFAAAFLFELQGRMTRRPHPPLITRYATWLMARDVVYSTRKARTRLGWIPALTYQQSIERTVSWYLGREQPLVPAATSVP